MKGRNLTRAHLKKAYHEATFLQGAQTPCARSLFKAIDVALDAMPVEEES